MTGTGPIFPSLHQKCSHPASGRPFDFAEVLRVEAAAVRLAALARQTFTPDPAKLAMIGIQVTTLTYWPIRVIP